MLIKINGDGHNITIPFPNALIFNSLTAAIASKSEDFPFSAEQCEVFFKALRQAKKLLGDIPFVEVRSSDGEVVIIKL